MLSVRLRFMKHAYSGFKKYVYETWAKVERRKGDNRHAYMMGRAGVGWFMSRPSWRDRKGTLKTSSIEHKSTRRTKRCIASRKNTKRPRDKHACWLYEFPDRYI